MEASASHVTSVLQEQLIAKTDKLEMYSRRSCVVLTRLCKEENENFNKLIEDVLKSYVRLEYLKKKSLAILINSTELKKLSRIILRTPS